MRFAAAFAVGTLALAGTAQARIVDYTTLSAENFAGEAARLKIAPISPAPASSRRDIVTRLAATGVDHDVLTLGNYCSAYKVENPIAAMLPGLFAAAARRPDGSATAEALTIVVASARSNQRCVEVKEQNVRCIARVTIVGEAEAGQRKFPVSVSVERDSSVTGLCGDRGRAVGVISREAGLQFLAAALAAASSAAAPSAAAPSATAQSAAASAPAAQTP